MTTTFTSLPVIDLTPLHSLDPNPSALAQLSNDISHAFETTGFAYLLNPPISQPPEELVKLSHSFFSLPETTKHSLSKKTFVPSNSNTYRGYFPVQSAATDYKEGFEMGSPDFVPAQQPSTTNKFDIEEPNVWPADWSENREQAESLHRSLYSLGSTLMSLIAPALSLSPNHFLPLFPKESHLSTFRFLHYPPTSESQTLSCTPHTDSGVLTLLTQDSTGGLEVLNAAGEWVRAPYIKNTLVVNIGDLMAKWSGGKFVATQHRVKASRVARASCPFFFEPMAEAVVAAGVKYEDYVLGKMKLFVEYQDEEEAPRPELLAGKEVMVH